MTRGAGTLFAVSHHSVATCAVASSGAGCKLLTDVALTWRMLRDCSLHALEWRRLQVGIAMHMVAFSWQTVQKA